MSAPAPTCWGPWRLDRDRLVLELVIDGCAESEYDVDLQRCTTAAEALDWIVQSTGKAWATGEIVGELVHALHDLLDPQARLCGFGVAGERIPTGEIAQIVRDGEIETRAWRITAGQPPEAGRLGEPSSPGRLLAGASLTAMIDAHARAVDEVRREFGLPALEAR